MAFPSPLSPTPSPASRRPSAAFPSPCSSSSLPRRTSASLAHTIPPAARSARLPPRTPANRPVAGVPSSWRRPPADSSPRRRGDTCTCRTSTAVPSSAPGGRSVRASALRPDRTSAVRSRRRSPRRRRLDSTGISPTRTLKAQSADRLRRRTRTSLPSRPANPDSAAEPFARRHTVRSSAPAASSRNAS